MEKEKSTYLTISKPSVGEIYKEKSSKFIGYAFPVISGNEIKEAINKVKKEHSKARHWCYAWQLGIDKIAYRANDDGEPNNSAGKPIYGQILSKELTNILIVVVRYYGGTKLGVGGLISAYKLAANYSLEKAKIIEKIVKIELDIVFEYKDINIVMRLINKHNIEIIDKQMHLNCNYKIGVDKSIYQEVINQINTLRSIKINKNE